jgi:putative endonuclease
MQFYTYILYSQVSKKFYIGETQDLEKRLLLHNSGKVNSTKKYKPYDLIWYMSFDSRALAMERERKLKNLKSQKRVIEFMDKFGTKKDNRFEGPEN